MIGALASLAFALLLVPGVASALDTRVPDGDAHHVAQAKRSAPTPPGISKKSPAAEYTPTVRLRLRTELAEGKLAFVGAGGDIE